MSVDLSQVVYSDQVRKVPFANQDGTPSTVRDLYLQMFSVIHEEDNKASIAKKEELLRVYRKVLNSEAEFSEDEITVLRERAAKIFPSIVIYSQISENLGH